MNRYLLACMGSETDTVISALQSIGLVDVRRSEKPVDEVSAALLARATIIKEEISGVQLKQTLTEKKADVIALQKELRESTVWGETDLTAVAALENEGYLIHYHRVSRKTFSEDWAESIPLQIIGEDSGYVCFVTVTSPGEPVPAMIPGEIERPRSIVAIRSLINTLESEASELQDAIDALPLKATSLRKEYCDVISRLDAYLAGKADILTAEDGLAGHLVVFEGFAPQESAAAVRTALDALPIYYMEESAKEDDTPVKLRNSLFARQFEVFTRMYGLPVYGEFDPTPILAPFFLLFFSMCMGDAGYGIVLMLIALWLRKKLPDSGLGKLHGLITLLGAGTFVVGIFLGTFFGISLFEASWVPTWLKKCMLVEANLGKIAGFDPQIMLSLGIGIFHICLAMVVKTACVTSRTGFRASLGTWGWTLLVVGGVIVAALSVGGLLGGNALRWTVILLAAISCLAIFPFNTPGRNPLLNTGVGLWNTYNMVTGLLGDTLSYVRLYALGLAGGMLGGTFNNLAQMTLGDNPGWQWIPFILIAILGHALNLALSCLGAFVHPLRLSFVEYFKNSGYEGRGTQYRPLGKDNINN